MPFPTSLVPLFQNESMLEIVHMEMSSTCSFIFMRMEGFILGLALKQRHKGTSNGLFVAHILFSFDPQDVYRPQ